MLLEVARPYANAEEFLKAEAWTIEDRSIVLVDQTELPHDTIVRFEIVLEDGSKPIRAEGKVARYVPPTGDKPGGLKVRFRRFDSATKRFIDRAVAERQSQRRSRRPPPPNQPLVLDEPVPASSSDPHLDSAPESVAPPSIVPESTQLVSEPSQVRERVVAAPPNREELLEKLRERAKKKSAV